MSSRAAVTLAHAIRRGAARHHERIGPRMYRGTITSLDPLGVDLLGVDLNLDDEDIVFSAAVNTYDDTTGLAVGDVLILNEMNDGDGQDGDFIAVGVLVDAGSD